MKLNFGHWIVVAIAVVLLVSIGYTRGKEGDLEFWKKNQPLSTTTPEVKSAQSPPSPFSQDEQKNRVEKSDSDQPDVQPTADPDPIVDCAVDERCGKTKRIRRSECESSACCEIYPGEWLFLNKSVCVYQQVDVVAKCASMKKVFLSEAESDWDTARQKIEVPAELDDPTKEAYIQWLKQKKNEFDDWANTAASELRIYCLNHNGDTADWSPPESGFK